MEKSNNLNLNGLLFNEIYIPEELLTRIFYFLDNKTLLSCQIVCKYWHFLIRDVVWRKRAEQTLGIILPHDKKIPWIHCYFICGTFGKNFIKNHSGSEGLNKHWTISDDCFDEWLVECPPIGVPPLPDVPDFEGNNSCFAKLFEYGSKYQVIDLVEEGISGYLMDRLQPAIKVSEWFCCWTDSTYARYCCEIELLGNDNQIKNKKYQFSKIFYEDKQRNTWYKFTHTFKAYGKGVRKICFTHKGSGRLQWNCWFVGRYSSSPGDIKMAGACVKLELPQYLKKKKNHRRKIDS